MPKTKEQKKKIVEDLKEKIAKQKAMVFVAIEGLRAKEIFDLRKKLKQADCLFQVAKKTLMNIVFKEKKIKINPKELKGQLALIFGFKDEILPAKIIYQFSLENKNLKILGGFFQNEFIDVDRVFALAQIPSKEELLTKVVGSISAPISNFLNVLQGNIKGLIWLLSNLKPQ